MPAAIAIFFVAIFSIYGALYNPQKEQRNAAAVTDVRAVNGIAYRSAVIAYLNANPSFSGQVPDSSITLPTGLVRDSRWTNVVSGGTLFIFEQTPSNAAELLEVLYQKSGKSIMVGKSNGTNLINARGINTGVVIPATTPAIPNGAIVIVGK